MMEIDDKQIIQQCLNGNKDAFEMLVEKYFKVIFNIVYRMTGNTDDAEDITQTVFIKVYDKLENFNPKYKFFSWLYRIVINETLNFLKAAKKVLEHEDTKFVVAGMGDMLPRLIDQAVDMGIADKVIFTGKLTEEEVRHIYQISNVYVMPSVSEPFGITALEAISAGTPTIVSKTAGVSETFLNCFKVDFWDTDEMANKIISLLRYDPLHSTLTKQGKQEIDLFTWDRVAEKTIEVYREVA